jgi:hypothetical protein
MYSLLVVVDVNRAGGAINECQGEGRLLLGVNWSDVDGPCYHLRGFEFQPRHHTEERGYRGLTLLHCMRAGVREEVICKRRGHLRVEPTIIVFNVEVWGLVYLKHG